MKPTSSDRGNGPHRLETPLPKQLFRSAKPRRVLGHGADFAVAHAGGHAAHHSVRVVRPGALLEGLELGADVFRVLAGDTRILGRYPGAGRAVTASACR